MPELKNCRRCNKVFPFFAGLPICPACAQEDERIFREVSGYIREHPGVSLNVVSGELNISYDKLMKYVKEGRLQVLSGEGEFVSFCEKCGQMIKKGKFCQSCEYHISNVLDDSKRNLQNKLLQIEKNRSDYRFLATDPKK
jgi:Zn finger protein HypA/HybF involved in hydrogenase expression